MFRVLYVHHRRFLYSLNAANARTGDDLQVLRRLAMQTSARNQFAGKIARLTRGAVNDEVELVLSGGDVLAATGTHTRSETLGLRQGAGANAPIKASVIIIAVDDGPPAKRSERKELQGQ